MSWEQFQCHCLSTDVMEVMLDIKYENLQLSNKTAYFSVKNKHFFTFSAVQERSMRGFSSKLSIFIFQITSNWLNQLLLQFLSLFLGKILSLYWPKVQLLHTIYICNISWTVCRFKSDSGSTILSFTLKFHLMVQAASV